MALNPGTAHTVDARRLLNLVPDADPADLWEIRRLFASFLASAAARGVTTWWDGWNAFTGATKTRPGTVRYTAARCTECKGRRIETRHVTRNLTRTGHPFVCGSCAGTGRATKSVNAVARFATRHAAGVRPTEGDGA